MANHSQTALITTQELIERLLRETDPQVRKEMIGVSLALQTQFYLDQWQAYTCGIGLPPKSKEIENTFHLLAACVKQSGSYGDDIYFSIHDALEHAIVISWETAHDRELTYTHGIEELTEAVLTRALSITNNSLREEVLTDLCTQVSTGPFISDALSDLLAGLRHNVALELVARQFGASVWAHDHGQVAAQAR